MSLEIIDDFKLSTLIICHIERFVGVDYESFGWWDLQGDGTHSDAVDAGADFEEDWSEFVEEDCSQAFDDVAF